MRYIFLLLLFINFAFANYKITYHGLKLGEIESFKTLNKHYFKIKITSKIARFLLSSKYMIFFNDEFKGQKNEPKTKYKKDNYQLINLIYRAINKQIKKDERIYVKDNKEKYIDIKYDKKYYFKYTSKNRIKTRGYIEIINGLLISFVEENNQIKIEK